MPRSNVLAPHTSAIIEAYSSGSTTIALSEIYGVSNAAIWHLLRRNGISTRDRSYSSRKYSVDHTTFSKIDTSEKAYALGFIYADGCNHKSTNRLVIASIDKDVLTKMLVVLGSNNPLHTVTTKTIGHKIRGREIKTNKQKYELRVSSKQICDDLERHGAGPRKTLRTNFPPVERLSVELIRHFIRGVYDGDGYTVLGKSPTGKPLLCFGICGDLGLLRGIQSYLDILGVNSTIREKGKIYELDVKGNLQTKVVLDHLYEGSTIHMDRKRQKYEEFLISSAEFVAPKAA